MDFHGNDPYFFLAFVGSKSDELITLVQTITTRLASLLENLKED